MKPTTYHRLNVSAPARILRPGSASNRTAALAATAFCGLMLASAGSAALQPASASGSLSPDQAIHTQPVVRVDYRALLNEPALRMPEDQRAWPIYIEALTSLVVEMPWGDYGFRPVPDTFPDDRAKESWRLARLWVDRDPAAVDLMQEAGRRPAFGYLYRPLHEVSPEELALYRRIVGQTDDYMPPAIDPTTVEGAMAASLFSLGLPFNNAVEAASRVPQVRAWMLFHDARGSHAELFEPAPPAAEPAAEPGGDPSAPSSGEPGTDPGAGDEQAETPPPAPLTRLVEPGTAVGDAIIDDLEAAANLAMLLARESLEPMQIAGFRMYGRVTGQAIEMLQRDASLFSDADLVRLAKVFGPVSRPLPEPATESKRLAFLDLLQRTYSDDGNGNGYLTIAGGRLLARSAGFELGYPEKEPRIVFGPPIQYVSDDQIEVQALIADDRRTVQRRWMAAFGKAKARMATPLWERGPFDIAVEGVDPLRHPFDIAEAVGVAPGYREESIALVQIRRDSLLVLIALIQDRRANPDGAWATSLESLVPTWLDAVPLDPFTGDPLLYRLDASVGAPLLYGRGTDLDDDGGAFTDQSLPRQARDAGQWLPREEVEARKDDPMLPNGDLILLMLGATPLGQPAAPAESTPTPTPTP